MMAYQTSSKKHSQHGWFLSFSDWLRVKSVTIDWIFDLDSFLLWLQQGETFVSPGPSFEKTMLSIMVAAACIMRFHHATLNSQEHFPESPPRNSFFCCCV